MTDPQTATTQIAIYGVPLSLWLTLFATLAVGVISAAAAIVVVWRSNANTRRNLKEQLRRSEEEFDRKIKHESEQFTAQLRHDAEQRDRDRHMSLRREVYLEAAAALIDMQSLLGRVTGLEHGHAELTGEFAKCLTKLAKVHVVGSQATVTATMTYINEFAPAFIELLTLRAPLSVRKALIDTHTELMNKAGLERERFVAMLQQMNLDGSKDATRWTAINKQYDIATGQFEMHQAKVQELQASQLEEHVEVGSIGMAHLAKITGQIPHAILAIRDELELALERETYIRLWQVQAENAQRSYTDAMRKLDELVKQMAEDNDGDSSRKQSIPDGAPKVI